MQSSVLDSCLAKISPRAALIVARIMAGIVVFFAAGTVIVALPPMIAAAYHRGFHFATIGAFIFGLALLGIICALPIIAAVGLWFGRRWAWWLQFALTILAILRHPPGLFIVALFIVVLVVIRDAYFRLERSS
jgi:hypothetical protein